MTVALTLRPDEALCHGEYVCPGMRQAQEDNDKLIAGEINEHPRGALAFLAVAVLGGSCPSCHRPIRKVEST